MYSGKPFLFLLSLSLSHSCTHTHTHTHTHKPCIWQLNVVFPQLWIIGVLYRELRLVIMWADWLCDCCQVHHLPPLPHSHTHMLKDTHLCMWLQAGLPSSQPSRHHWNSENLLCILTLHVVVIRAEPLYQASVLLRTSRVCVTQPVIAVFYWSSVSFPRFTLRYDVFVVMTCGHEPLTKKVKLIQVWF